MLISIVIPVYNVADYLQTCIDSILANDCRDCEVILVDDGSTDGISPQICDENAERHPELIRVIHQENKGPGGARNTGLEAARGEYLFFVDSDDTVAPGALKTLYRAVRQSHSEIYTFQMASHEGKGVYTPMDVCPCYEGPFTMAERPEVLLSQPAIWARLWRRDLFMNMGIRFPDKAWYGEDLRTVTKLMALASSIEVLPDCLYFYLIRPGSIMRSENIERNRDILRAFEDMIDWFGEVDAWVADIEAELESAL
ncbi:MAG: glycosyltransferase [Clostridia bacterium]|nr:glycosyltransferase [Clostridia bacterium]